MRDNTRVAAASRSCPDLRDGITAVTGGLMALLLYLHTLAPSITLANGAGDSGELASTAYTLGIAHPTGYPLYTLLGYVVTHLGTAEPAYNLNILSAVMGAATIGLLLLLSLRIARQVQPHAPWVLTVVGSSISVAAFALSSGFWTEAVVAETRTLALALDTLVVVLLVLPARQTARHVLCAALVYGLALSDHLLSLYLAPAVITLLTPWARMQLRRVLAILVLVMLGLSPYLYLPLRASAQPAANWGNPNTVARFLWMVSGQEYRYLMFGLDGSDMVVRIGDLLGRLWLQLTPLVCIAAVPGILALPRQQRALGFGLLLTLVIDIVLTSNYQADAAPAYLLLGALCLCVAAAAGLTVVMQVAAHALARLLPDQGISLALVPLVVLGVFGWAERPAAAAAYRAVVVSQTTGTRDQALAILRSLPPGAVILASGDEASIPLWYAQRGLRLRPDVTIIATGLLSFAWYYKQVRRLPVFDHRFLPDSDDSTDDGTDFTLSAQRTLALAGAVAIGHDLFAVAPEPALDMLCRQAPFGPVYRCIR